MREPQGGVLVNSAVGAVAENAAIHRRSGDVMRAQTLDDASYKGCPFHLSFSPT